MVSRRWLINLPSRRSVILRIQIVRLPTFRLSWIISSLLAVVCGVWVICSRGRQTMENKSRSEKVAVRRVFLSLNADAHHSNE
jgi:hypothetical protein